MTTPIGGAFGRGEQLDALLRLAVAVRDPAHLSLICRAANALTALCYAEICAAWYEALPPGYVADAAVHREEYLGRLLAASEVPARRVRWERLRVELCETLDGGGSGAEGVPCEVSPQGQPQVPAGVARVVHAVLGSPAEIVAEWDRLAEEERRGAS